MILFEMIFGYAPFSAKTRHMTRMKIMNFRQHLEFPSEPRVSKEAIDLIKHLICDRDERLGSRKPGQPMPRQRKGTRSDLKDTECVQDIKNHPWFRSIDFETLHTQSPPFKPFLSDPLDTRYFEEISGDEVLHGGFGGGERARDIMLRDKIHGQALLDIRKDLAFKGYTYRGKKRIGDDYLLSVATKNNRLRLYDQPMSEDLGSVASTGRAMSF